MGVMRQQAAASTHAVGIAWRAFRAKSRKERFARSWRKPFYD